MLVLLRVNDGNKYMVNAPLTNIYNIIISFLQREESVIGFLYKSIHLDLNWT